jgi:signal transduction histidine kinase
VRLKSGIALSLEPTVFRDLLEEVEASAMVEARSRDSHMTVSADPNLRASVDRQVMVSAVANLLHNAIQYSPTGAHIQIRARRSHDGGVTVEVEDACGGLPEDQVEHLFRPFVRGEIGGPGLGLGLAIARHAVEAHGGALRFLNRAGKGCIFMIQLPTTLLAGL